MKTAICKFYHLGMQCLAAGSVHGVVNTKSYFPFNYFHFNDGGQKPSSVFMVYALVL